MNWDNGYMHDGYMNDGWGVAMMFGMLAVWIVIAIGVVWAVRSSRATDTAATNSIGPSGTAEQILAERFARGEIDQTEYESRLKTLIR